MSNKKTMPKTKEIGLWIERIGEIDISSGNYKIPAEAYGRAKVLIAGATGGIVAVRSTDGTINGIPIAPGQIVPFWFDEVFDSATDWQGDAVVTTATPIYFGSSKT